jgi:hypothetical protein
MLGRQQLSSAGALGYSFSHSLKASGEGRRLRSSVILQGFDGGQALLSATATALDLAAWRRWARRGGRWGTQGR